MDKTSFVNLSQRVIALLKPLEDELKIKFSYGGGSVGAIESCMKLRVLEATNGEVKTPEALTYAMYKERFNLVELNETVVWAGRKFKIGGYNVQAVKYPILGYAVPSGKGYKLPLEAAQKKG